MSSPLSTRRAALLSLSMIGASALAYRLTPKDRSSEPMSFSLEAMVPLSFADWRLDTSLRPVAMRTESDNVAYAVYDALLERAYANAKGERVMISLGYSRQQGGVQKPHWQEICYRAQGFKVTDIQRNVHSLAGRQIPMTRMLAQQGRRVEPVTYWLTLGDRVVKDRWDRLGHLLAMGLSGESAEGFLVRVSSLSENVESGYALHLAFAQALLGAMAPQERDRLVGAA